MSTRFGCVMIPLALEEDKPGLTHDTQMCVRSRPSDNLQAHVQTASMADHTSPVQVSPR